MGRIERTTRRAFTLIELLVSMSIIAIVVSILLPALAAARSEGIKTKCLSRMRGIASAATAYSTDDPRGAYGPVHPNAGDFSGEGYSDYGGGPGLVRIPLHGPGGSVPIGGYGSASRPFMWDQAFDPSTRPLNKFFYGAEGLSVPYDEFGEVTIGDTSMFQEFRCPGEDFGYQEWPGWPGLPDEVEHPYFWSNGTSYRLNNLVWEENKTTHWVGGVYGRAVSQVPDSSLVVGFMEARAFQTIWTNDRWGFLPHRGELSGYHKKLGFFNVSYVDGHVSFVDMGDGTYFQRTLDNSFYDVRGTWGRMDCLPDKLFLDP